MNQPLLDAAIGLWLAEIFSQDDPEKEFGATFATTDHIAVVASVKKGDILPVYDGTLLSRVIVTPHQINFVDKAFQDLPADARPHQFFWSVERPTEVELKKERQPGNHSRRIWMVHPTKKICKAP